MDQGRNKGALFVGRTNTNRELIIAAATTGTVSFASAGSIMRQNVIRR